jgi:uncharacterized membrane protein YvbJ
MPPEICPNCGGEVPRNAKACPECGSCENTGWSEAAAADNLGLPDQNFDYQDFVKRELNGNSPRQMAVSWYWWVISIVLVLIILAIMVR